MLIIDANAILRYVLVDNAEMADKVEELIRQRKIFVKYEVMAEVIYVLEKVYKLSRDKINDGIKIFLNSENIEVESIETLRMALDMYRDVKIDFVDALLFSYKAVENAEIFTFDKKLNSLLAKFS